MIKKLITPSEIEDGMILAETIMKDTSQILYALNMKLTTKHRDLFKTWGIKSIYVYVEEKIEIKEEPKNEEEIRLEADELLKKRMKWVPRNPNEKDLMEMGLQNISENYF